MQGSDAREAVMFQQPRDFSIGAASPGPSKRLRLGQADGEGMLASPNPSLLGTASPFMSPAGQVSGPHGMAFQSVLAKGPSSFTDAIAMT